MLWITLFIVGLLVLLAGIVPLLLNGRRGLSIVLTGLGAFVTLAGIAGVIIQPSLTRPIQTTREGSAELVEPPAPAEVAEAPAAVEPPAAPEVRTVKPDATPAPAESQKDESQLQPSPIPDPRPIDPEPAPDGVEAADAPPLPAPSPAAAPAEDGIAALALAAQQPKDQTAFTTALTDAKTAFEAADVEDQMDIQPKRAAAICKALPKPEIKNWIGQVRAADADSGGRLTVTVALPDGTLVKTWNNAMSDLDDNTLVPAGTPIAATFGKLKAGDPIRFSGTFFTDDMDCYRSTRLALGQSVMEPSFLFRFTAVDKL
jgi:hypothetical protein